MDDVFYLLMGKVGEGFTLAHVTQEQLERFTTLFLTPSEEAHRQSLGSCVKIFAAMKEKSEV